MGSWRAWMAALLIVLLSGCGSGGGAAAPAPASGNALFRGTYALAGIAGVDIPPLRVTGVWGTAEADGIDEVVLLLSQNELGVVSGPNPPETLRFSVGLDRTLGFRHVLFPFHDLLSGGISATGEIAAATLNLFGGTEMFLFVREGSAPTLGSLAGSFHVVGYSYDDVFAIQTGWVGVVTFDGAGGGSLSAGINNNGTIAPYGPAPVHYTVGVDGEVTVDLGNDITVSGRITSDGELLLAAGSTTTQGPPAVFALLRTATSVTDADFSAFYHTVAFGRDMATLEHVNGNGVTVAQGDGNVVYMLRFKDESVQTVLESDSGTYATVSNGSVVITTPTDSLRGAVSASGDYAILGRLSGPDPDPSFWLLFR